MSADMQDSIRETRRHVWLAAVEAGDMHLVQSLAAQDTALLARSGAAAMTLACSSGQLTPAQWLAAQGVSASQDSDIVTAAAQGHWRIVEWQMDMGANLRAAPHYLAATVPDELAIFRRMLADTPYVAAYGTMRGQDEKILAACLEASLMRLSSHDSADFAAAVLDAGLDPSVLYERQIVDNGLNVLRCLYIAGYRPTKDQLQRHNAAWSLEMSSRRISAARAITVAWGGLDVLYPVADDDRKKYAVLLARNPAAWLQEPVAVLLAQAGHFSDVAGLLPRHGAALLLARSSQGISPADILASRGELHSVFTPEIWQGHEDRAQALWQALPPHLRATIDYSALTVAMRRQTLQQKGRTKFKLGGGGP